MSSGSPGTGFELGSWSRQCWERPESVSPSERGAGGQGWHHGQRMGGTQASTEAANDAGRSPGPGFGNGAGASSRGHDCQATVCRCSAVGSL